MTADVILIDALPRRAADGVPQTVRLAGGGGQLPYFYAGQHWRAGITGKPKTIASIGYSGVDLGTGGVPQALVVAWSPSTRAQLNTMTALFWVDAAINVYCGKEGDPPLLLSGVVLDAVAERGLLQIAMADPAANLKKPILVDRFAGTGGAEGPAEWAGRIRRRGWGRLFNVPGEPIDPPNNIYCYGDPQRAWQGFDEVRDMGVAASSGDLTTLAWQGSVAATFAALQTASATQGGGVLCPSIACIKWWTEPAGALCVDARGENAGGYVQTAPEIAQRIVTARSTIGFAAGTIAAAAAARPAQYGWMVDSETATIAETLDKILGDVSLLWVLYQGAIVLRPWAWAAPVATARSHEAKRLKVHKPIGTRRLGYQRNWNPMTRGEIGAQVFNGASAFTLENYANTTIGTNWIEKTGGVNLSWDASAHSAERFVGGCSLSFTVPQTDKAIFVGLNSDPTTDADYASIDYAFYFRDDGAFFARQSGAEVEHFATYAAGDRFQMTYDGAHVRWLWNGVVMRTVAVAIGTTLALDTSFAHIGGRVENITWAGAGTAGLPGVRGDDGITYHEWVAYADSPDGTYNFMTGTPNGRTYQGRAPGRTTSTESTNPADYTWSAYVGPPNFGLVAGANMVVSGARLFKSGGAYAWDSQVYSSESFSGGAFVSFRPEIVDQMMIGLNTDPTTNADYNSIDHAIYIAAGGLYDLRTNNGSTVLAGGSWALGDTFALHYRGNAIDYKKNGVTVYTHAVSPGQTFWLDSSFTAQGHNATILAWAAAGAAGSDGADGVPGAPGADGQTLYEWNAYADSIDGTVNFVTGTPGGRAFAGRAINKTTPVESTNPADYQWNQYTGPASFGLVNFNGNSIVGPNFIQKIGGTNGAWDASAYSSEAFIGAAALSFQITGTASFMVGLNTDPTTNADYASLDYAFFVGGDGNLYGNESGSIFLFGPYYPAIAQIVYNGKTVDYIFNGSLLRSVAVAPGIRFYLDTSIDGIGQRIEKLTWAAAGAAGNNGANGATGDTVRRIWTRSSAAPATPTGNLTPSGWTNDPPAPNGLPLWSSDGRISGADNVTLIGAWSTPVIAEAQAINLAATTIVIDSQNDTFGPIIRALDPSQAISVVARIRVALTVGPRTQSITTEFRLVGAGSWTTLASNSETDASFVAVGALGTITNSTGVSQTYEIRATTVMSSPNGDVQLERSYFRA